MTRLLCIFVSALLFLTLTSSYASNITFTANPKLLAKAETRAWQDYYEQEEDKVFADLVTIFILSYNLSHQEAVVVATDYATAAAIFAKLPQNTSHSTYEKEVLPHLVKAYASLNEYCGLKNYQDAAKYDLAWMVERRDPKTSDPVTVGHSMAQMIAAIYGNAEKKFSSL